jgi:ADP-ribosylglycohydrolase
MRTFLVLLWFLAISCDPGVPTEDLNNSPVKQLLEIPCEQVLDKVRGGLLGQIIGNINGIPHEFKYNETPGNVTDYVPTLKDGAFTDDDTDIEWVYLNHMERTNQLFLDSDQLADIWKQSFNQRIWCSNGYVRRLLDIGINPPYTGSIALNPWAEFNISGQFICETFGLICPAMPQSAARLGLNYTRITIDAEPAQTTQFFTTMIAMSFLEDDIPTLLDYGYQAVDPDSKIRQIVDDIKQWHLENPEDWRVTRKLLKEKYTQAGGSIRDGNGFELITGATVAALLYGDGHFVKTLETGFNFGWDCDNVTATSGTIIGTIMGYKKMMGQGWDILDRYENTSRDGMPRDETITTFADRIYNNMEQMIVQNGGKREIRDGRCYWLIPAESPGLVEALPTLDHEITQLGNELRGTIEEGLLNPQTREEQARSVYLAVCLDLANEMSIAYPDQWDQAKAVFNQNWKLKQLLFHNAGNFPSIDRLRAKFNQVNIVPEEDMLDLRIVWSEPEKFLLPEQANALTVEQYQDKLP